MNRKIISLIVLSFVLLACLLACGYFGVKTFRRTRLRRAGMTAYENKEYILAERLLRVYVQQDPNAEAEFVALASIYHEFGNTGAEAQMWQTASSLNPLNAEYYDKMLDSAVKSASYPLLHDILGRKVRMNEKLNEQELYLYVISSYRTGYQKDGNDAYLAATKNDPEAFHKNELGQMAEFMVNYSKMSETERDAFLSKAMNSEDPVIRFESLYFAIRRQEQRISGDPGNDEELENLLKQIVKINYFVGTPLLADYYFSAFRFGDVIDTAEPYLKTIDDINLYLLYAESCVFEGKLNELKVLKKTLQQKSGALQILADYCDILIAYMDNDEERLAATVRKTGKIVQSPLSRFIRLRVAIGNNLFNEIRAVAQEIFSAPPFHDLHDRATIICLDYISREMEKTENKKDPSQMADLAKILSGYLQGNQMLTEIILMDQYKKGLVKEEELISALKQFPDDAILQRITAEYLILNGKSEQALDDILEPILSAEEEEDQVSERGTLFLYMLALDQLARRDEAAAVFQKLVEQSEFDLELLAQYFHFCSKNERVADLTSMADKLDTVKDGKLEHYGKFFRAEAILVTEDESKLNDALDLLASTPTGDPEFTFYAANSLLDNDRFDEAEAKYKAILKTYRTPPLILVNLSELYHAKGDEQKALEAAKEAFDIEKNSMLPAFIYAQRLSEAKRYEEAVSILNFPRHAVNYREDIVDLWTDCMHHVIENSIAGERYMQAEEQCKHLLTIAPDDEFGKENLEKVQKLIKQQNDKAHSEQTAPAA